MLFCLQVALWGNKCDLSISQGADNSQKECILEQLKHLKKNILLHGTSEAFAILQHAASSRDRAPGRVDIVLDNSGFELITDFCLAELLLLCRLASSIHFHGKKIPWFVSDVTENDFLWTLQTMNASDDCCVSEIGAKWQSRIRDGIFLFDSDVFWTSPYDYSMMSTIASDLYKELCKADLIFFKGDLNYRKLVGDRSWDPTTDFSVSLRGFRPTSICSLRALKADTVVGLKPGLAEKISQEDEKWQVNGSWAAITVYTSCHAVK